uniref:Flavin-containing monooxygenase n=1 Tax=Mycena chlorophos TaxID=658473 RepID=A0ABQ0KVL7_MYCCL|nr:flavin-containing monooxygenase [Mycena chlorophos]
MTATMKAYPLPTLDRLGVEAKSITDSIDTGAIASAWLSSLASALSKGNTQAAVDSLFLADSHWRDMLALTWDFRTLHGAAAIHTLLSDRLVPSGLDAATLKLTPGTASLLRPYPDIAWINAIFSFKTSVGQCLGVFRIVPTPSPTGAEFDWKAHVVYTTLDDLQGHPEQIGSLRNPDPNHGKWVSEREAALAAYETEDPVVLIIGAGHSGLDTAARLEYLGVRTLVVDKNARVGDNWRNRYEALCLHDPVWYDHMPYLPFPPTWPVYAPAVKVGNWLEHYADTLEIDVWTSATVSNAVPSDDSATPASWRVTVSRPNKPERHFTVRHLIFATGIGSAEVKTPQYPGMDTFPGQVLHSSQHKRALDHAGKKVVVVGACTSGHDIAADYEAHSVDVTIFQRSSTYILSTKNGWNRIMRPIYWEGGPPSHIADILSASFPHFAAVELNRRLVKVIAEDDKEILDGLKKVGFNLNEGVMGAGFALSAWSKAGGYYIDVGTSKLIADGKIKLKNNCGEIESFTSTGLRFTDGSSLPADVVVFATGYGDPRRIIHQVCGPAVGDRCKPIWGLDEEGELQGVWRDLGMRGLWYMFGNYALSRFHSKHVALQIKAMEEGIWDGKRYSLAE